MPEKPKRLFYTGGHDAEGRPLEWFAAGVRGEGIPARDLDEADIAQLSDETIALITSARAGGAKPLYQVTEPRSRDDEAPPAVALAEANGVPAPTGSAEAPAGRESEKKRR